MAISKTDDLFRLIKSLTKAEKRTFRLFAERIKSSGELLYMQLFDIMDKQKKLDERSIRSKLGNLSPVKYSNAKRHLYEQILTSLRMLSKSKRSNIQLREYIDFVYILYGKGFHLQALKVLQKAKKLAKEHHHDFNLITIIELEKLIHSRHITRQETQFIEDLTEEALEKIDTLSSRVKLSNLKMLLHRFYIEKGHVKNAEEAKTVTDFFEKQIPVFKNNPPGQMENVLLYQSHVWYYYILNDFENCYEYSLKWVQIFQEYDELQTRDINLFLRAYHYLLTCSYNLKRQKTYAFYHAQLEAFRKDNYNRFNRNTQVLSFLYTHSGRLNLHFLNGTFAEGVKSIRKTLARLDRYKDILDTHKVMIFYYKIAWMYLGNRQPDKAIKYLNYILDMTNASLRSDIQAYARLMFLMVHFELEHYELLPSLIRTYSTYFTKKNMDNKVQTCFLQFFKEIIKAPIFERKPVMIKFLEKLQVLENNQYEQRAFLYLDSISWLKAKIERRDIGEVIRERNRE